MDEYAAFLRQNSAPERPRTGLLQFGVMNDSVDSSAFGQAIREISVIVDREMVFPNKGLDEIQILLYFLCDGIGSVDFQKPRLLPGRRKLRFRFIWHELAWRGTKNDLKSGLLNVLTEALESCIRYAGEKGIEADCHAIQRQWKKVAEISCRG